MTETTPPCTGTCSGDAVQQMELACGCADVFYADGTACYEHNHVECGGAPEVTP